MRLLLQIYTEAIKILADLLIFFVRFMVRGGAKKSSENDQLSHLL